MTKRTATYVPPEPTQKRFNADLRTWLESIDRKSRKWARQTTIAANGALRHLYARHGLHPREMLALLEQQKRFALFAERDRKRNPAALALAESVRRLSSQPEYASTLRYFGIDIGQTERNLPHRPRDEWTERVVPLVNYFLDRTGKPLYEYAGALVNAAFPEFRPGNVREAIKKRLKRFEPSNNPQIPVLPLHRIVGRDARRAAVRFLADNARQDVLAMEIVEINRKIKERFGRRQARKTKTQASKTRRPTCDTAHCAQVKGDYNYILEDRVSNFAGRILNEQLGGIYFVCAGCLEVRHDLCDGRVVNGANRCDKCKPR